MKLTYKEVDHSAFIRALDFLRQHGKIFINVYGTSMLPLFKNEGEEVVVTSVSDWQEIKKFDVVVFWQNNILICHYFWRHNKYFNDDVSNPTLLTRPLNPIKGFDHPIKFNQILGTVKSKKISFWTRVKVYLNIIF